MRKFIIVVAGMLVALTVTISTQPASPYDVLIRSGRVLDGSGNPWIAADIGIRSGRIVDMGEPPHLFAAKRVCTL